MSVIIETSKGDIVVDVFVDECPKAATNFLKCDHDGLLEFSEKLGHAWAHMPLWSSRRHWHLQPTHVLHGM